VVSSEREVYVSEMEKATVRACLGEMLRVMAEARDVTTWWVQLSESNKEQWKDFGAAVGSYRMALQG